MTPQAERIKKALEYHRRMQTPYDESTQQFIEELKKDIGRLVLREYPFLEASDLKMLEEDNYAAAFDNATLRIQMKGYAFDSLVMRYEKARDAQMRAEQVEERREGGSGDRAKSRAQRDKMRFIQILDEVIGEHD